MKKIIAVISKLLQAALIVLLLAITALTLSSMLDNPWKIRLYTVQSGSMSPSIRVGSLVFVKGENNYRKGNIITFKRESDLLKKNPKSTVTHRIAEVKETTTGPIYITKGDANNGVDSQQVFPDLILGKVILTIPFLGYIVAFAKTGLGLVLLIIIPAVIVIIQEIINIRNVLRDELRKRNTNMGIIPWKRLNICHLVFILSFIAGFVFVHIGLTHAYFTKSISFGGNVFSVKLPPSASLVYSSEKKEISFTVTNISSYSKLKYTLTFDSDDPLTQGVVGTINLTGQSEVTRDILLGTCSTGGVVCTYLPNPHNFQLKVDLEDGLGGTITVTAQL